MPFILRQLPFGDVSWPSHSPELNMCDYSWRGHLKEKVFQHKLCSTDDLKAAICTAVMRETLEQVWKTFPESIKNCLMEDGHH